jgi:conjugal transfer mating pair stabilization protein TraG
MTLDIVVYGNGDVFREYFNAIVMSFGTSDFSTLIEISILLGGITVIASYVMQKDLMVLVKWFGLYYLAIYMMFTPKTSVEIIDRVNQGHVYAVDNVPLGLGIIASYTSVIGDALTQLTEMNFTMPDDLRYAQTGLVFSSRIITEGGQFEITDSIFDANLQSFISQCVFYDILMNRYTIDDLMSTNDLWHFVEENTSPARAFLYSGTVTVCKQGAQMINDEWGDVINKVVDQYAPRIFPSSINPKEQLNKYLPLSYGYLTQLSNSASQIMQQNLMANAFQRGILHNGAILNSSAAIESYAYTRAQEQKRLNLMTLGDMAAYWLPLMKNAFEAIMYGSFIFVVLLSVFPFGWFVLKNYVYTLLWIQLWSPLYAVINLMVSYYAQTSSTSATAGILSLKSMAGLTQINSDIASIAGYLTLSVPFLAKGLASGMAGTFTQLAQYIGGVTQAAGTAGATEAITGNMSLGNTSFGNHSAFNTNANHFNTSGSYSSGQFTTQLPGGSSLTMTADGSQVLNTQNAISNLGTSVNLSESIRSSASKQSESAYSYAQSEAQNYAKSLSSAMRNIYDLSHHTANSTSGSEGWNMSMNAATGEALNSVNNLTQKFARDHNLSYTDAQRVLSAAYVEGRAGVDGKAGFNLLGTGANLSAGASIGGRHEKDHSDAIDNRGVYAAAKDFVRSSGYSTSVDTVQRAVHDHSLRSTDENGNRLLDGTSASLDRAESARNEMTRSYQAAESYKEVASQSLDDSRNVNSNLGQVFKEWMMQQPGSNGKGKMRIEHVESIMTKHPYIATGYAQRFSDEYVKNVASHWNNTPTSSGKDIYHAYQTHNNKDMNNASVQSDYNKNTESIDKKASHDGMSKNHQIDASAKIDTEKLIQSNHNTLKTQHDDIKREGAKIQHEVNEKGVSI